MNKRGGGGEFFYSGTSGEQKKHVQEIPQGEQKCTSLQESGTSSWLLLHLLDSLLREKYCSNEFLCFKWLTVDGRTWLYMIVHDCTWLYMVVHVCTVLYMVVHSCTMLYRAAKGSTRL